MRPIVADEEGRISSRAQVSRRSVDPAIRRLLNVFLGEPDADDDIEAASAARTPFHERPESLA